MKKLIRNKFPLLLVLIIFGCQNFSKENNLTSQNSIDSNNPLLIGLGEVSSNLCSGNVIREFERLNNQYVVFQTTISSIKRTYLNLDIIEFKGEYGTIKANTNNELLKSLETNKKYLFRGVFRFNSLEEDYCDVRKNEILIDNLELVEL